jgi:thiosulfate dehydrogenase
MEARGKATHSGTPCEGMAMIKQFLPGVLLGMCLPFLGGYVFIIMGGMPVTTKDAPLPFERYLAKKALKAAMRQEIGTRAPMPPDDTNLLAGAKVYRGQCAVCHGLPNQPLGAIAKGMVPPPLSLFSPDEGVTDDPEGKIYWKVKYGIRLTGMPGFQESLSETELWQVSLLLLKANQLSEPVRQSLLTDTTGSEAHSGQ